MVFEPSPPARLIVESPVELSFERGIEDRRESWPRPMPQRDQVTAEHKGARRGLLELKRAGLGDELVNARVGLGRGKGRATVAVGAHDGGEFVDRRGRESAGEAAHRGVGKLGLAVVVREMVEDEGADGRVEFERRAETAQESFGERAAGRFVAGTDPAQAAVFLGALGGGGFAKIMREHREHE